MVCGENPYRLPRMVSDSRSRVPLHHRSRGAVLRPGALRPVEHIGGMALCQGDADSQLPRPGGMDTRQSGACGRPVGQPFLRHHAGLVRAFRRGDVGDSLHHRLAGPDKRLIHHILRSHQPQLLATSAHQISYGAPRPALHTVGQHIPLPGMRGHSTAFPHIGTYGGRIRPGHHRDDARHNGATGRVAAPERGKSLARMAVLRLFRLHRGGVSMRQSLQVHARRLVHHADSRRHGRDCDSVVQRQPDTRPLFPLRPCEGLSPPHFRHQRG